MKTYKNNDDIKVQKVEPPFPWPLPKVTRGFIEKWCDLLGKRIVVIEDDVVEMLNEAGVDVEK